jgi:DNA-binding transcriptional regulator YiaG
MLDVLEAGVEALRSNPALRKKGHASLNGGSAISPEELRTGMAAESLSVGDVANALSVPRGTVEDWLGGRAAIPAWVPVTMRMIALLPPSARRKLQNGAAYTSKTKTEPSKTHPFSRIEEL